MAELILHHARASECQDVEGFKAEMARLVTQARKNTITLEKVSRPLEGLFLCSHPPAVRRPTEISSPQEWLLDRALLGGRCGEGVMHVALHTREAQAWLSCSFIATERG